MGASTNFISVDNANGDWITVTGSVDVTSSPYTLATWFYWDGIGGGDVLNGIVGQDDVNSALLHARVTGSVLRSSNTVWDLTTPIVTAKWYFGAITFDSATTGVARLYLGDTSTAITEKASSGSVNPTAGGTTKLIGAYNPGGAGGARSWNGELAYFHEYSRALPVSELQEIQWKHASIVNGLHSYYPMNNGSPEVDMSGNGLDGTITGTPSADASGPNVTFPEMQTT